MAHIENGRCFRPTAPEQGPSLFQNGNLVFQAHHVGWIVAGSFTIVSAIASFWLINKHLQWYTNKREQRYIVRLLFMVPIYASISLASYFFWNHSTPLLLIRDCYESIVLTSFFYLLLMYLSPDTQEQQRIFLKRGLSKEADMQAKLKGEKPRKWVLPLGFIKWKPQDGMYFLQIMKWGVLQYAVIRPVSTLASVVLDYMGLYCEESWGLGWGHVYLVLVVSLSVTVAMYCLIQLYVVVSKELAEHKPLLKLFSVKAVVFLTFWQATFLSVLTMFGLVKDTKYMTAADINIGIGALLECFEMMLFAFLHIKAFSYRPYRPSRESKPPPERTPRWRSLLHAMNLKETFREIWQGSKYMYDRSKGRQPKIDASAMRVTHFGEAFERPRPSHVTRSLHGSQSENEKAGHSESPQEKKPTLPAVHVEVDQAVEINGERQWLGVGDDYGYGLGYVRREPSETLSEKIQKELEKRGYGSNIPGRGHIGRGPDDEEKQTHQRVQHSWWKSIYRRISQSGHSVRNAEEEEHLTAQPSRSMSRHVRQGSLQHSRHHSREVTHHSRNRSQDPKSHSRRSSRELDPHSRQHSRHHSRHQSRRHSRHESRDPRPEGAYDDLPPNVSQRLLSEYDHNYRDPPPEGFLRPYSSRFNSGRIVTVDQQPSPRDRGELDMLAPLSVFNDRRESSHQRPRKTSNPKADPGKPSPKGAGPYLSPPSRGIQRSDSLLGRVFPYNTDNESSTEQGHVTDSAHSLPSVSADGVSPSKATPKARLTPSVPKILPQEIDISLAGQRITSHAFVDASDGRPSPSQIRPSRVIVESDPQVEQAADRDLNSVASRRSSHRRESAIVPGPTESPADEFGMSIVAGQNGSAPSPIVKTAIRNSSLPPGLPESPSSGLRRNHARKRQSLPPDPSVGMPSPSFVRQPSRRPGNSGSSSRRRSDPYPSFFPPAMSQSSLPVHEEQIVGESSSTITQPSYSGTLASNKYFGEQQLVVSEDSSRYPSFPGVSSRRDLNIDTIDTHHERQKSPLSKDQRRTRKSVPLDHEPACSTNLRPYSRPDDFFASFKPPS